MMYKCLALLSLCLWAWLPVLAPMDAAAQGVSGRGISGNVSSQVNQACQLEVDDLRDDIRDVINELDALLDCNRQGMILALDGSCREVVSPAHAWSDTTLAFAQERTGENTYTWAAGVDLKGDKGPKGESITCYSPGDAPPPPPGNDNCSLPWGGTIAHGESVTAYEREQVAAGQTCTKQTRSCNDGNLSGSYQYDTCRGQNNGSCASPSYSGPRTMTRGKGREGYYVDSTFGRYVEAGAQGSFNITVNYGGESQQLSVMCNEDANSCYEETTENVGGRNFTVSVMGSMSPYGNSTMFSATGDIRAGSCPSSGQPPAGCSYIDEDRIAWICE